jgi:hypothetical protein
VLAAGVPGATDNVRIISVIGRFLEHSRIYFFQNGSEDPLGGKSRPGTSLTLLQHLRDNEPDAWRTVVQLYTPWPSGEWLSGCSDVRIRRR